MKKREPSIDILRFVGLSLLILAHTECPNTLMQIRSFDVPLMVFISGLSYSGKNVDSIWKFYWARIKRLIIPVWTFIPIYLLPHYILQKVGLLNAGFTWAKFFESFVFYGEGMGYIWIFKVFIIVMLATPFLIKLNDGIKKDSLYFIIVVFVVVLQQLLCLLYKNHPNIPCKDLIETYGLYILGYLPLFMLGVRVRSCTKQIENKYLLYAGLLVAVTFFFVIRADGLIFSISDYKYPPQMSYLAYGGFASLLLWYFRKPIVKLLDNRYVLYIGKNSDWIYLWHAFFVTYVLYFIHQWWLQYIIIYALALVVNSIQKRLVAKSNSFFLQKFF